MLEPAEVLRDIAQVNPIFRGFNQQDAQEFFQTFMNRLHDEMKIGYRLVPALKSTTATTTTPSTTATSNNESKSQDESTKKKEAETKPETLYKSIITDVFEGTLESKVKCLNCKKVSTTKDKFFDLSLSIPDPKTRAFLIQQRNQLVEEGNDNYAEKLLAKTSSSQSWLSLIGGWLGLTSHTVDLEDCLLGFCANELLTGSDKYFCENCKAAHDSLKIFSIQKSPEILCIHIKRFRYDYFGTKISTHVNFPLEDLDLRPFLTREEEEESPSKKEVETNGIANGTTNETNETNGTNDTSKEELVASKSTESQPILVAEGHPKTTHHNHHSSKSSLSYLYDLVAIVNHRGGLGGGHYVAYAKNYKTNRWFEYDDQYISEVSEDTVRNVQAYMLFYRRKIAQQEELFCQQEEHRIAKSMIHSMKFGEPECYIPKSWYCKWKTMSDPGPISNNEVACSHGGIYSYQAASGKLLAIPELLYDQLVRKYGGGPKIKSITKLCSQCEAEERRERERAEVNKRDRTHLSEGEKWYIISSAWLAQWHAFVKGDNPPGPISNQTDLLLPDGVTPKPNLQRSKHFRGIAREVWEYLHGVYGGGPAIMRDRIEL